MKIGNSTYLQHYVFFLNIIIVQICGYTALEKLVWKIWPKLRELRQTDVNIPFLELFTSVSRDGTPAGTGWGRNAVAKPKAGRRYGMSRLRLPPVVKNWSLYWFAMNNSKSLDYFLLMCFKSCEYNIISSFLCSNRHVLCMSCKVHSYLKSERGPVSGLFVTTLPREENSFQPI
jgi:hypothetical protein